MSQPLPLSLVTLLVWSVVAGQAAAATPTSDQRVDFQSQVYPLLQDHCGDCHGRDERNAGIGFDSRAAAFAVADSGEAAIVPGDPDSSELIARITSDDDDLRMPPDGSPLSDSEIATIHRWLRQGADWPEDESAEPSPAVQSDHWALQPIARPSPPSVRESTWAENDLDRFIQAKREQAGLTAALPTDAHTLMRRATYGLTGLPPTPAEIDAFHHRVDRIGLERAFAELVDELLARPSYGERWGRHWMDWVRYADTAGDNSDFPIPQAYRYRNYIIDSLNNDVPYDRFLTEQLAGDLMPAESLDQRNRQTIATGYLAMARRFGSLVERYPWHLTIEDTIDNMGRTMMGMTIACARCHDHKFDPISTRDYYGLYGIFASTRYPFPGIELFQTQRDFVPLGDPEEVSEFMQPHREEIQERTERLETLLAKCEARAIENAAKARTATIDQQREMRDELDALLLQARNAGKKLAEYLKSMPPIPSAYAVQDAEPTDAVVQIKGEPTRPGASVPRKFPDVLGGQRLPEETAERQSGRLQLAAWVVDEDNPLTARVIVNRVWQRHFGTGLVPSTSDFGIRGDSPTHPELLDWLATEFIRGGWSLKRLHRLIMNSQTYRMSSRDMASNHQTDPENHLYWKFNRQRLDAESIRDTLLMLGGALDRTPRREPYDFPARDEWTFTQHHPFKDDYPSNRRSVYQLTKRLTVESYMQTFDGPDPNVCTSDRDQSVTSLQALYFVNADDLHRHAEALTKRLLAAQTHPDDRIAWVCRRILGRTPDAEEADLMRQHVAALERQLRDRPDAEQQAWSSLTRSLLRLNEFVYLD